MKKSVNKHSKECTLCPRKCHAKRMENIKNFKHAGFCGESSEIKLAFAGLHFGEEPCLCRRGGSGTLFFTGCTLKCRFCQNIQISRQGTGEKIKNTVLMDIMLELQKAGADNINFVSGTHFTPQILMSLTDARKRGLNIPAVWNTSGYEDPDTVKMLNKYIDIYLTDIKTLDSELSLKLFNAGNYPGAVKKTLPLMIKHRKIVYEKNSMIRGVIIRHLVLPGYLESTKTVLRYFKKNMDKKALLSVMFQYEPLNKNNSGPGNRISRKEYEQVISWVQDLGIEDGFVQEIPEGDSLLPDFTSKNPFPEKLCKPVWHY